MISRNIILPAVVVLVGHYFGMKYVEANVLVGEPNELNPEELYRMDLEIFKNIDRYYNVFRKAKVWEQFQITEVRSAFKKFHAVDTNVPELKHYMNFFGSLGPYFKNITLLYSILYTKYTAMFYAINLLNIYKITKKENEEIAESYLKISQYFAWYGITGNTAIQEAVRQYLPEKLERAKEQYEIFVIAYNEFIDGMFEKFSKNDLKSEDKWKDILEVFKEKITIVNQYFTAIFTGTPVTEIREEDFLKKIEIESFLQPFVSDLVVMKGRDVDETFYKNVDNSPKRGVFEANIINLMWTIANRRMQSVAGDQKIYSELNEKFIILKPTPSIYTCLKFQLSDHQVPLMQSEVPNDEELKTEDAPIKETE